MFFLGDSVHIVPIFGVRGLKNGLADARNIGWKLGQVLNGAVGEALLDSYTPERRGATLDVETVYEALARGIDAAGPARSELFLAKAALPRARRRGGGRPADRRGGPGT